MSSLSKTDIPKEVFRILKIDFDDSLYTSKDQPSGGGGTVKSIAWERVVERLEELVKNGSLIID